MATLFDSYNAGDNSGQSIDNASWYAQTFTASDTYQITSVKLLIYRSGSPGTVTVTINTASSNLPTSTILVSATTNGNTLPTGSPYEWREITFATNPILTSGTQYAIVVHSAAGTLIWRVDTSSPTYTGGRGCVSNDGGVGWAGQNTVDTMFETWGDLPTYKTFSTVSTATSSETVNLSVSGIVIIETNSTVFSLESGKLTITGIKLISTDDTSESTESGTLSIIGSQFISVFDIAKSSENVQLSNIVGEVGWPVNRPQEYNSNYVWGYDSVLNIYRWINPQSSQDILAIGGGRYHNQLIIVGHKCIYYKEI
jgi:hypothetical protein